MTTTKQSTTPTEQPEKGDYICRLSSGETIILKPERQLTSWVGGNPFKDCRKPLTERQALELRSRPS